MFASHYIELVKNRAYNQDDKFTKDEQNGAIFTLHYCLDAILKLLAPIIPFVTYKIYEELDDKDIHFSKFPEPLNIKYEPKFTADEIVQVNSLVWKSKKDRGFSLKSEIKEATLPEKFRCIEKDMIAAHKILKISYDDHVDVVL
jgi:valyl-tRNA synthetase